MGVVILLEQLERLLDGGAALVDHVEVLAHIPEVTGNEPFDLQAQRATRGAQLLVITGLDILLPSLFLYLLKELWGTSKRALKSAKVG